MRFMTSGLVIMFSPAIIAAFLAAGVESVLGFSCDPKATDVQSSLARVADFQIL